LWKKLIEDLHCMTDIIINTAISFIVIGLLGWFIAKSRNFIDRYKVYQWLKSNTSDTAGKSHVDTIEIAKGTKLSDDRVRKACMSCRKIYRYSNGKEKWSVWRKEPQSIYDNLTKDEIERMMY